MKWGSCETVTAVVSFPLLSLCIVPVLTFLCHLERSWSTWRGLANQTDSSYLAQTQVIRNCHPAHSLLPIPLLLRMTAMIENELFRPSTVGSTRSLYGLEALLKKKIVGIRQHWLPWWWPPPVAPQNGKNIMGSTHNQPQGWGDPANHDVCQVSAYSKPSRCSPNAVLTDVYPMCSYKTWGCGAGTLPRQHTVQKACACAVNWGVTWGFTATGCALAGDPVR